MTKIQKIWMWIFVAMFAIPEIIWGPTFGYTSFVRDIFEMGNRTELLIVLFIQMLGMFLFLIHFSKNFSGLKNVFYWMIILISMFVFLKSFSVFYILFATYGMWR